MKDDLINNIIKNNIVIYETEDGKTNVDVYFEGENIWMSSQQIEKLFNSSHANISEHIKNIYEEKELDVNSTCRKFRQVQIEGKRQVNRNIIYYSLELIIAVGYRVKSKRGTEFRKWATKHLKEFIQKGFILDDERLKKLGGGDYFKELLERIRDIRSSEKVLYRQVLDLYATSSDYDPKSSESIKYFKIVQNKFHYATHGKTASEVIYERADASKDFMGLITFSGEMPKLKDVVIAKNYLNEKELKKLNNLVSGYFDFAEQKAEDREVMCMKDYVDYLDKLLKAGDDKVLLDSGSISHEEAIKKAKQEYKKYQKKTLSKVEMDYIETIRGIEKNAKKAIKANNKKNKK